MTHLLKLTDLYACAGVSKQSMYKYRKAEEMHYKQEVLVVAAMQKMRKSHRKMSSRKVYCNQKEAFNITSKWNKHFNANEMAGSIFDLWSKKLIQSI